MNRPRATAALLVAALALAGAGAAQAGDTSAGARKLAPVKAARMALAHFRALQGGQSGTTLTASVTAAAHNGGTATWTISKSVDEDTLDLETGESETVHYTITVTKTSGSAGALVDGEVCVENDGGVATEDLAITVDLKHPATTVVASSTVDVTGNPVLDSGEDDCYAYSIDIPAGEVVVGDTYKVTANVTITNHSGSLGEPKGPSPSATTGALPEGSEANGTIHVTDDMTDEDPWEFSASGSEGYDRTFECDDDEGPHVNTATITETGQTAQATVTVTCTPPPPPVDVCPNIEGDQTEVPEGMVKDENGDCVTPPPPVDVCPNLEGDQTEVPAGMVKDGSGNCVTPSGGGGGGGGGGGTSTPASPPAPPVTPPPPPAPPAAEEAGEFTPPAACGSIRVAVRELTVGRRIVLRIVVKDTRGKVMKGVKVTVRGAGLSAFDRTGRRGIARVAVTPRSPGVLTISAGSARCTKRLGVLGVFQPPVTG